MVLRYMKPTMALCSKILRVKCTITEITENGAYYKDLNAWNTNKGVIYISEGDLDDIANEISDD